MEFDNSINSSTISICNAAANKRLYASWAFSNRPSALEFQINFSSLALANRVLSGQASSGSNPSPPCVKPRTLATTHDRRQ